MEAKERRRELEVTVAREQAERSFKYVIYGLCACSYICMRLSSNAVILCHY